MQALFTWKADVIFLHFHQQKNPKKTAMFYNLDILFTEWEEQKVWLASLISVMNKKLGYLNYSSFNRDRKKINICKFSAMLLWIQIAQTLICEHLIPQTKANLEKAKTTLEAETTDLANDLKSVQMAKQESERKRKQVESQFAELSAKFTELERTCSDSGERAKKLQVTFFFFYSCPNTPLDV